MTPDGSAANPALRDAVKKFGCGQWSPSPSLDRVRSPRCPFSAAPQFWSDRPTGH